MLANPVGMRRLGPVSISGSSLVVSNPRLQALHSYWRAACGPHAVAAKEAFDFKNLRMWLGHIALIEVERDPIQFRFRLYGTYLAELAGADHTGKFLDQCFPRASVGPMLDPYYECVDSASPAAFAERYRLPNGERAIMEQLLLPCSSDRKQVDVVVGALYLEAESASGD